MVEPRRRLSPEDRRDQLLDIARDIVVDSGVAACTIDQVSHQAGVTPQLAHKYFGTRASLLQDLFRREDDTYRAEMHSRLAEASTFEDVVRIFVTANFDQLSSATAIGDSPRGSSKAPTAPPGSPVLCGTSASPGNGHGPGDWEFRPIYSHPGANR